MWLYQKNWEKPYHHHYIMSTFKAINTSATYKIQNQGTTRWFALDFSPSRHVSNWIMQGVRSWFWQSSLWGNTLIYFLVSSNLLIMFSLMLMSVLNSAFVFQTNLLS